MPTKEVLNNSAVPIRTTTAKAYVNTGTLKTEDTMSRSQFAEIASSSTSQMRVYCGGM
ncbi:hypothetical protein [Nostoc sp. PCC 9305]|uniref:hypothetical protein n=1 Tax=Nostoc sp. PCC 9305 TaxID=296636 RepID=UPI0039C65A08